MKIQSTIFGDVAVLSLVGELDSRGHQTLDKSLRDLVEGHVYKVVLDLSSIRFMGQQTLSLLLSHMKELRANGGDVRFLNPQRALMQYLKQNRVIELFKVYSTRSEALDSYKIPETSNNSSYSDKNPVTPSPETASATATRPAEESSSSASPDNEQTLKSRFETGEILYANSCMLATLIKVLESKGMLSPKEASDLMDFECLSLKGVSE